MTSEVSTCKMTRIFTIVTVIGNIYIGLSFSKHLTYPINLKVSATKIYLSFGRTPSGKKSKIPNVQKREERRMS